MDTPGQAESAPSKAPSASEDAVVLLPARLVPYLEDLSHTGLFGKSVEAVALTLLEEILRAKVQEGLIRARRDGRRVKE